jgi:hypothetical protein
MRTKFLVGKPEENRPYEKPGGRLEKDTETDLKVTGRESAERIHLHQNGVHWQAFVNTRMKHKVA